MNPEGLTFWVIWFGARNHPAGKWVMRPQTVSAAGTRVHEKFFECDSLLEARSKIPPGLVRWDRMPGDDPAIVETWF